ncbi:hypothetical protein Tco_1073663 [Tanacetum coccineum]
MNEYKGIMPIKIELTLEQSQQGVSNDVLAETGSIHNLSVFTKMNSDIEDDIMDPVMQCTTLPSHSSFSQQKLVSFVTEIHTTSIDFLTPKNSLETKLRGRLLESFQEDAKYEHVGQDTRSQGGKDDQDKQGKDLKISKSKTKSKDNDKGSKSKITQHEGTSLQLNKDQRLKNSTTKKSQQVQGSKIQDLTSGIRRPHIRGDC